MTALNHVFSSLRLRHKTLKNRIVFGAHTTNMARAVANAGVSGSAIRDMMLEAVELRFKGLRRPGWVRSSAWICDFSSTLSTTACAGGST